MSRSTARFPLLMAVPLALALTAACSSNNNNTPKLSNNVIPPSIPAGAQVRVTPSPVVGAAQVSPSALAAAGAQVLKEVTTDNKYSETAFTAKANQDIALTLTNNGQSVHNWHLLDVKDADGKDIQTQLIEPGKSETIDFKITKPGTYHFQCDVHPADMKGTLTIK